LWVFVRFILVVTEIKKSECIKESFILIELNVIWVRALPVLMHPGLKTGPSCCMFYTKLKEPCSLSKVPDGPYTESFLISSRSKKKEPRCVCLSEAKASHHTECGLRFPPQYHISYRCGYYSAPLYIDVFSRCYVQ